MLLTIAITITAVLYVLIAYITYVTASILHKGITYRLAMPIIKSLIFILLSYTSIISDILLFHGSLYKVVSVKNGLLLLLVVASLFIARLGKETEDENSRE